MAVVSAATVQQHLDAGQNAQTTAAKGRALEDLICYVLGLVPGVAITHRNELNAFETEEIDVAIWNNRHADGFPFLPHVFLVECKNWSKRVASEEIAWFDTKLRNRGQTFGILITTLGITGNAAEMTAGHAVVAAALREGRQLIVVTTGELLALNSTEALVELVKKKICDLVVKGTVC